MICFLTGRSRMARKTLTTEGLSCRAVQPKLGHHARLEDVDGAGGEKGDDGEGD
jgi:hypothetical protein